MASGKQPATHFADEQRRVPIGRPDDYMPSPSEFIFAGDLQSDPCISAQDAHEELCDRFPTVKRRRVVERNPRNRPGFRIIADKDGGSVQQSTNISHSSAQATGDAFAQANEDKSAHPGGDASAQPSEDDTDEEDWHTAGHAALREQTKAAVRDCYRTGRFSGRVKYRDAFRSSADFQAEGSRDMVRSRSSSQGRQVEVFSGGDRVEMSATSARAIVNSGVGTGGWRNTALLRARAAGPPRVRTPSPEPMLQAAVLETIVKGDNASLREGHIGAVAAASGLVRTSLQQQTAAPGGGSRLPAHQNGPLAQLSAQNGEARPSEPAAVQPAETGLVNAHPVPNGIVFPSTGQAYASIPPVSGEEATMLNGLMLTRQPPPARPFTVLQRSVPVPVTPAKVSSSALATESSRVAAMNELGSLNNAGGPRRVAPGSHAEHIVNGSQGQGSGVMVPILPAYPSPTASMAMSSRAVVPETRPPVTSNRRECGGQIMTRASGNGPPVTAAPSSATTSTAAPVAPQPFRCPGHRVPQMQLNGEAGPIPGQQVEYCESRIHCLDRLCRERSWCC